MNMLRRLVYGGLMGLPIGVPAPGVMGDPPDKKAEKKTEQKTQPEDGADREDSNPEAGW